MESAACGLIAGINAARLILELEPVVPPATTALGALLLYITDPSRKDFQPMNANFGLLPAISMPLRGRARKERMVQRALADVEVWAARFEAELGFSHSMGWSPGGS